MVKTSDVSIHDNFLVGYEVSAEARKITLKTEFRDNGSAERTDVVFSGVEAYRFENDSLGTILFEIQEIDIFELLEDEWALLESSYKASGWPGPWATSIQKAKDHFGDKKCRAFSIQSSIGMTGWILARSKEILSR